MYDQIQGNALQNGVAQGSNFWNLYTVGTGADDPYQVTLADTSTMNVIGAHVRPRACPVSPVLAKLCHVFFVFTHNFEDNSFSGPIMCAGLALRVLALI